MKPSPIDRGSQSRRNRRALHAIAALVLLGPLAWTLLPSQVSDQPDLVVTGTGGVAPDFTVDLLDGSTFSLSRHLSSDGRPVVMNFWASWCVPCREEMPVFDLVARHRREVLFLGVAVRDTEPEARAFASEVGVDYPLAIDRDGQILERYPIVGLPTTWFIAADGTIAGVQPGEVDEQELEGLIDQHLGR